VEPGVPGEPERPGVDEREEPEALVEPDEPEEVDEDELLELEELEELDELDDDVLGLGIDDGVDGCGIEGMLVVDDIPAQPLSASEAPTSRPGSFGMVFMTVPQEHRPQPGPGGSPATARYGR